MSDTLTADLETGAGASATPELESQSLGSLMDDALEMDAGDEVSTAPTEQTPGVGVDRGDGRDVRGKFATKAEQDAANAAAAAVATKPGDAPAAPKPGEQPSPAVSNAFRYRAMGSTHELEGSTIDAEGNTVIPAAHFDQLREAFASMHQLRTEYGPAVERYKTEAVQLRAALKEANEGRGVRETQAESLVSGISQIAEIEDPGARLQAAWDFLQTIPQAKQKAETDYWRERAERAARPAPNVAAAQPEQGGNDGGRLTAMPSADTIRGFAKEYLETWKTNPKLRDVPAEAWGQVEKRLAETPFAFMRQATAEHAKTHANDGINEGDLVFDRDLLFAPIHEHIATSQQAAEHREAERKRIELATSNARRTQTSVNAPPVAGGTQIPAKPPKQPNKHQSLESLLDDALADE